MNSMEHTAIISVLYNPTADDLEFVKDIASVYSGVIVDNSSIQNFKDVQVGMMHYIPLKKNTGIAYAQNTALRYIKNHEHPQYILFMDQDSRYPLSFPNNMGKEYSLLKKDIPHLALLGPTIINKETGRSYKSVFHREREMKIGFIPKREIISSGSITDWETLTKIGFMAESLFIDFVDFEWCWRALRKGYICGLSKQVTLNHKVGISNKAIGNYTLFRWSPFRYYYQYRNYIWLSRLSYTPWQWRIATGVKFFAQLFYIPFFMSNGVNCWKQMMRGLYESFDGFSKLKIEIESYEKHTK